LSMITQSETQIADKQALLLEKQVELLKAQTDPSINSEALIADISKLNDEIRSHGEGLYNAKLQAAILQLKADVEAGSTSAKEKADAIITMINDHNKTISDSSDTVSNTALIASIQTSIVTDVVLGDVVNEPTDYPTDVQQNIPPDVTDLVVTEPVITDPVTTEPVVTDPVATEPVVTDPVVTVIGSNGPTGDTGANGPTGGATSDVTGTGVTLNNGATVNPALVGGVGSDKPVVVSSSPDHSTITTPVVTNTGRREPRSRYIPKKRSTFRPEINGAIANQNQSNSFVGEVASEAVNGNVIDGGMAVDNTVVNAPKIASSNISSAASKNSMRNANRRRGVYTEPSSKQWGSSNNQVQKSKPSKKKRSNALSRNKNSTGISQKVSSNIQNMENEIKRLRNSNSSLKADYGISAKDTFATMGSLAAKDAIARQKELASISASSSSYDEPSNGSTSGSTTSIDVSISTGSSRSPTSEGNKKEDKTGGFLKDKKTGRENLKALNLVFLDDVAATEMVGKEFMTVLVNDTTTQKVFLNLLKNPDTVTCENLSFVESFFKENLSKVQTTRKGASELLVQSGDNSVKMRMPNRLKVKMMREKHCADKKKDNIRHTSSLDTSLENLPEESVQTDVKIEKENRTETTGLGKIIDAITGN
jgi:hypothetical protein